MKFLAHSADDLFLSFLKKISGPYFQFNHQYWEYDTDWFEGIRMVIANLSNRCELSQSQHISLNGATGVNLSTGVSQDLQSTIHLEIQWENISLFDPDVQGSLFSAIFEYVSVYFDSNILFSVTAFLDISSKTKIQPGQHQHGCPFWTTGCGALTIVELIFWGQMARWQNL